MPTLIGQTLLNRYQVLEPIGRGGMAEVYKVYDQKRAVHLALKLLHEDLAQDRVFLRRFQREAQTLAKLQHPNIVRFYGFEQDGRQSFLLMDYVEGESLRSEIFDLDGKPMALPRVWEIMQSICSALHYAHAMGLVHCDLKPGNVMMEPNGRVLVSDFGIARMTDAATATMVGAGTPAYMSPEQIKGADPTPQMDVYALGVVLFEMLTGGERPFTGERSTVTGTTGEKVRWEHLNLQPPSPRKWNPAITSTMEAVVLRCLAKNPADRYAGAQDLLTALEMALAAATQRGPSQMALSPDDEATMLDPAPESGSSAAAPGEPRNAESLPATSSRDPLGENLLSKLGLPVWAWGVIAAAVVVGVFLLLRGGAGTPAREVAQEEAVPAAEWVAEDEAEEWTAEAEEPAAEEAPAPVNAEDVSVCYVAMPPGSIDDPRHNARVLQGVNEAESLYGIEGQSIEVTDGYEQLDTLASFVAQGCTLIIDWVWDLTGEVEPFVAENPGTLFSIFSPRAEDNASYPNLIHQAHALEESAVLAGFLAAGATQTGRVGIVLNDSYQATTRIADTFVLGVDLYTEMTGNRIEVLGWDVRQQEGMIVEDRSPEMGYLIAEVNFVDDVDVLFPYTGYYFIEGVAAAAQEHGALIIGRDFEWSQAYPQYADVILTSIVRRYDVTTAEVIRRVVEGEFEGGTVVGTLANGGVDLEETPLWEERLGDYWLVMEGLEMITEGIQNGNISTSP